MGNYKLAGPVLLHTALPRHAMDDHGEGGEEEEEDILTEL